MLRLQTVARPILIMIVVATHSATVARSWFEIPNSGHKELIPPSGSFTPCQRKYPHAATIRPLVPRIDGYQLVRPNGFHTWPRASCTMNRPTRVPASSTVKMNKRLEHDREVIPQRHAPRDRPASVKRYSPFRLRMRELRQSGCTASVRRRPVPVNACPPQLPEIPKR